ncbi:MAG: hypothetical protein P8R42_12155 [Candidatus Binatia bacterium]|nr:hypothetical protein [Candidatus Binatia bacterium]
MNRTFRFIASAITLTILVDTTPAAAWEFKDFMNPQGDRGTGIVQPALNNDGVMLAFGCDRDRWRQVAILPQGEKPLRLASDGKVSIGFTPDSFTPDGKWKVRAAGRDRAYFAPAPTPFMERLYREEKRDAKTILYVKLRPAKKSPIVLQFPVAGLRKALADHLWKDCKLDIYFGPPE